MAVYYAHLRALEAVLDLETRRLVEATKISWVVLPEASREELALVRLGSRAPAEIRLIPHSVYLIHRTEK